MNKTAKPSRTLLLIGIILFSIGSLFAAIGYVNLEKEMWYEENGSTVSGIVTDRYVKEKWEADSQTKRQTKRTTYYVKYRFNSGREDSSIESSVSVDSSLYESLKVGDRIDIQFITSDPSKNRIAGQNGRTAGFIFSAIGGVTLIVGACLFGLDLKRRLL